MKKSKIYIKNKMRVLMLILLVSLMNMGTNIISIEPELTIEKSYNDYIYVTAKAGDTLWSITSDSLNHMEIKGKADFRDLIGMVSKLNGGEQIKAGQVIRVPKVID